MQLRVLTSVCCHVTTKPPMMQNYSVTPLGKSSLMPICGQTLPSILTPDDHRSTSTTVPLPLLEYRIHGIAVWSLLYLLSLT